MLFWSYFYWSLMIAGFHAAITTVLLFRICPAPEAWSCCVGAGKSFIVIVHVMFVMWYNDEPGHPSFWLLGFAMWAWSDALATVVLIDFNETALVERV